MGQIGPKWDHCQTFKDQLGFFVSQNVTVKRLVEENVTSLCITFRQGCQIWHPNWVILAPNGTYLGLFKIRFQITLFARTEMNRKLILKSLKDNLPDCRWNLLYLILRSHFLTTHRSTFLGLFYYLIVNYLKLFVDIWPLDLYKMMVFLISMTTWLSQHNQYRFSNLITKLWCHLSTRKLCWNC